MITFTGLGPSGSKDSILDVCMHTNIYTSYITTYKCILNQEYVSYITFVLLHLGLLLYF